MSVLLLLRLRTGLLLPTRLHGKSIVRIDHDGIPAVVILSSYTLLHAWCVHYCHYSTDMLLPTRVQGRMVSLL